MRDKARLEEIIAEGEDNRGYHCDVCSWAEGRARLIICTGCEGRLVCHECRGEGTLCSHCAEFDLPEEVLIVGDHDKCDIIFTVASWIGVCEASHYYVDARKPYDPYGKLDLSDWISRIRLRTERIDLTASYIRRMLKLMVKQYRKAIRQRKDKKFRVCIQHKDTRARLMKRELARPLDGD